ncbi:MAG: hypothetical protein ABEK59_00905 [Halobacteria archaeon]
MYTLEHGFEVLNLNEEKPLERVIKNHQKELGLASGNKVFETLSVRSSQGLVTDLKTAYPKPGEIYTLSVDHKAKA